MLSNWRKHIWIKIIALAIVVVFLPEQVAWAVEYNPRILWQQAVRGLSYPPGIQSPALNAIRGTRHKALARQAPDAPRFNKAVAQSIYRFLKPLVGKPVRQVQIAPGVVIEVTKSLSRQVTSETQYAIRNTNQPFQISKSELKSLYKWLKDPRTETVPCSAYTVYHLLRSQGKQVSVEQLSSLLILIDVLVGNIAFRIKDQRLKTKDQKTGNRFTGLPANRIYNSLYALQKTAEYFGLNLSAVQLNNSTNSINSNIFRCRNLDIDVVA